MILQLLKHSWLQFWRAPTLKQNMVQTFFIGFFALYFMLNMLVLGYFLGDMIDKLFPGQDFILVVGGLLLYYFLLDLLTRYFLQKFPSFDIKPYLTLPVKKSTVAHYLLLRSLGHFLNILPFFFLVPFFLHAILPFFPTTTSIGFVLFSIGMICVNNFLAFWIDKSMALNKNWVLGILIAILFLFFLEMKGYIAIFPYLQQIGGTIIQNPLLSAIPLASAGVGYFLLQQFFTKHLTLDVAQVDRRLYGSSIPTGWFERFGKAGVLMDVELKLMLRSKRARAYLIFSVLFLLYPLLGLGQFGEDNPYVLLVFGLFLTGMIMLNHGMLLLSWNSLHFDLLQSRGHTLYDLFLAKYYILCLACLFTYILSLPYFFWNPSIVLFNTAVLPFNMTVSIFVYMLLASYNSLRIDPNEGNAFSMNGFGAAHYMIFIPMIVAPCLLYLVGSFIGGKMVGLLFVASVGIIGLVFHQALTRLCVEEFKANRYRISAAFRKKQ